MSKLPPDVYAKYVENTETCHITAFTFAVLGIVLLAGGKIQEGMFLMVSYIIYVVVDVFCFMQNSY